MLLEGGDQLGLGAGALEAVAGVAEELQVVEVVGAAFGLEDDVVDGEVLEGEGDAATVAEALLLAEGGVLVGLVVGELADIGALGDVFAVD